jgi:hypothetical protein
MSHRRDDKYLERLGQRLAEENAAKSMEAERVLWQRSDGTPIEIPTTMLEWARAIDTRFGAIEAQYKLVSDGVEENTALTKQVMSDTASLVEVAKALNGVVKFLEWTGKIAGPIYKFSVALVVIALFIVGGWTALKSGVDIQPDHLPK